VSLLSLSPLFVKRIRNEQVHATSSGAVVDSRAAGVLVADDDGSNQKKGRGYGGPHELGATAHLTPLIAHKDVRHQISCCWELGTTLPVQAPMYYCQMRTCSDRVTAQLMLLSCSLLCSPATAGGGALSQ
jgi:hypothetical protein